MTNIKELDKIAKKIGAQKINKWICILIDKIDENIEEKKYNKTLTLKYKNDKVHKILDRKRNRLVALYDYVYKTT